jgi:succinate dehydrogenase / fumarate reductase cytochrome b subunit
MDASAAVAEEATLYRSTVGKKAVMAGTSLILFGYVLGHLLGNLQIYAGAARIDAYGAFLHRTLPLLWGTRVVLVVAVLLHAVAGIQLYLLKRRARPIGYHVRGNVQGTLSARTMLWSGLAIAGFVTYHLLDLTLGTVHPGFRPGEVYANVIATFRGVPSTAVYAVGLIAVGMHLRHGLWSFTQSLGFGRAETRSGIQTVALATGLVVALGYVSIPAAVWAGWLR